MKSGEKVVTYGERQYLGVCQVFEGDDVLDDGLCYDGSHSLSVYLASLLYTNNLLIRLMNFLRYFRLIEIFVASNLAAYLPRSESRRRIQNPWQPHQSLASSLHRRGVAGESQRRWLGEPTRAQYSSSRTPNSMRTSGAAAHPM